MSKKYMSYFSLTIFIFGIFVTLAGCESTRSMMSNMVGNSSPGQQRAKKTTSSMRDTQEELMEAKKCIENTITALDGIVQQQDVDLGKQYNRFAKEMNNSEKQYKKVCDSAKNMQAQGDAFFLAWEQEQLSIENPDIRKRSAERRTDSLTSYQDMTQTMQRATDEFKSLLTNIGDIQKYLDIDLTTAGISSISTQAEKTKENAATTQSAIDAAISEIDRVIGEMPPT